MKIVIAYASVGGGHQKAAQALYDYLKHHLRYEQVLLIDVLEKSSFIFRKTYANSYAFMVAYAPWLWAILFWTTYAPFLSSFSQWFHAFSARLLARRFLKFLTQENPDIIISTHFLPSGLSAYLKNKGKITSYIVNVVTDFGVHPFWVSPGIDIYVAAGEMTKKQLIVEGVMPQNIQDTGIPIDEKFLRSYDKAALFKKYNLKSDEFKVLIITGSFGLGPIEAIVEELNRHAQLLVVCAHNNRLYSRLKRKTYPQVQVFGFIDYVSELMAVSDIIITKPGGLTISELLAMELVPIFISPIPGQERENVRLLEILGIGISSNCPKKMRDIVLDYKNKQSNLEIVRDKMRQIKKPQATEGIYDVIRKNSFRPGS